MSTDSEGHAAHRPPGPPPTSFGNLYPKGDIVAAVEDRPTAEALVGALRTAGFPESDLDILEPAFVVQAAEELERRKGLLGRIGDIVGDEGYFAGQFLELARAGHPIVLVHAPATEAVDRARPSLGRPGVLRARHYGALAVTDL
jgi:hypothetical protein